MPEAREDALYNYVATVMTDRRVIAAIAAQSFESFSLAVAACLREDLAGVWRQVVRNGAKMALRRAEPLVRDVFAKIHCVIDNIGRVRR